MLRYFRKIRDIVEETETLLELLSKLLPQYTFTADSLMNYSKEFRNDPNQEDIWYGPRVIAAEKAAKFFMDVVLSPDHICEIRNADGTTRFVKLMDVYEEIKYDLSKAHVPPCSCFDDRIVDYFKSADESFDESLDIVVSESGHPLNGYKDANNPNNRS